MSAGGTHVGEGVARPKGERIAPKGALGGLWRYVRPYAGRWVGSLIASLGATACGLMVPALIGSIVDDLSRAEGAGRRLSHDAALLVAFGAGASTLLVAMRWLGPIAARRVMGDLRSALFERLTLLEPAYFHRTRTGDLLTRFSSDIAAMQNMLTLGVVGLINLSVNISVTLWRMEQISADLALTTVVAAPLYVALMAVLWRSNERQLERMQAQQSLLTATADEALSAIRLVKASGLEELELKKLELAQRAYRGRAMAYARINQSLWAAAPLLLNLMFVGALLFSARTLVGAQAGSLTVGGFVAFTTYLFVLFLPLTRIGLVFDFIQRGVVSWGRLRAVLETEPAVHSGPRALPASVSGITFEGVGVRIGDRVLLDQVSFHLPRGHTLGVTGRTGAGKSLVAALLARQLDPTSGRILVDGVDLKELSLESLRRAVGVVPQEPLLFSRSLGENISFGLDAPPEELRRAAGAADLLATVESLPGKFDTVVGERGVTLSGGQRQRTALARALLRRPAVLVLDDALSAVDAETEERILTHLRGEHVAEMVMVIGHRISTFRHADEIIVLEHGAIAERGTHELLLGKAGLYAELHRLQQLAEALALDA